MYGIAYNPAEFRTIERNMRRLNAAIGSEIAGAGTKAMADVAAQEAKALVAVDTGRTRRSIRVVKVNEKVQGQQRVNVSHYVIAGTPDHRAALFLEFGTTKMSARPFLRPALRNSRKRAFKEFEVANRRFFLRFVKSLPK